MRMRAAVRRLCLHSPAGPASSNRSRGCWRSAPPIFRIEVGEGNTCISAKLNVSSTVGTTLTTRDRRPCALRVTSILTRTPGADDELGHDCAYGTRWATAAPGIPPSIRSRSVPSPRRWLRVMKRDPRSASRSGRCPPGACRARRG